jgi:alpha-glucoside transport system substrate-binding protein
MKARFLAGAAVLALSAGAAAAQDLKFPVGEGAFNWDSYKAYDEATNLDGQTLKIFGPWRGEDQVLVENMLAYFTAASGVKVEYSSSENYEQQIVIDTEAGSPPDIAILPQPGLIADLVKKGFVSPLGDDTQAWLADNYAAGESWVGLGSYAGPDGATALYAFPYKIDVKSLVWYSPDNFADAGYAVPQTMEELKALTDQIVADGGTPWCIGLGSGGATGWPATDWVEDLMLRTQSPDVYDKWVKHEIAFNDPAVVAAIDEFGGSPATTPMLPVAPLPWPPPTSVTARRVCFVAAAVLHAPSGLVHPVLLPRRHRGGPGCRLLLLPGLCGQGSGQAGSGRGHAGLHHQRHRSQPRLHRMAENPHRA